MCDSPVWRKNTKGLLRPTPCKRCISCRNARREDFTQRLQNDYKEYGFIGSFVTLTYRDSELPTLLPVGSAVVGKIFTGVPAGTLYKPDVKNFLDNLNHKVKKRYGRPIRYILTGEYGLEEGYTNRPHYHAIILGLPSSDRKLLLETWKKGKIDIQPVSHADIRYTLKYIDKQTFGAQFLYEAFGDYEPTFGLFSKGLGQLHYKNHSDKYDELGRFYFSDKKYYQLPEYYLKKYGKLKDSKMFSKNIIEFDRLHNNNDLFKSANEYNRLNEQRLIMKERARHKVIHNTLKDENFILNT